MGALRFVCGAGASLLSTNLVSGSTLLQQEQRRDSWSPNAPHVLSHLLGLQHSQTGRQFAEVRRHWKEELQGVIPFAATSLAKHRGGTDDKLGYGLLFDPLFVNHTAGRTAGGGQHGDVHHNNAGVTLHFIGSTDDANTIQPAGRRDGTTGSVEDFETGMRVWRASGWKVPLARTGTEPSTKLLAHLNRDFEIGYFTTMCAAWKGEPDDRKYAMYVNDEYALVGDEKQVKSLSEDFGRDCSSRSSKSLLRREDCSAGRGVVLDEENFVWDLATRMFPTDGGLPRPAIGDAWPPVEDNPAPWDQWQLRLDHLFPLPDPQHIARGNRLGGCLEENITPHGAPTFSVDRRRGEITVGKGENAVSLEKYVTQETTKRGEEGGLGLETLATVRIGAAMGVAVVFDSRLNCSQMTPEVEFASLVKRAAENALLLSDAMAEDYDATSLPFFCMDIADRDGERSWKKTSRKALQALVLGELLAGSPAASAFDWVRENCGSDGSNSLLHAATS